MSSDATMWAKRITTGSANTKHVLRALADYADEAWSCYPGQERLARETELSVRTVRRILDSLEETGVITREERRRPDGYRTSDRIYLNKDHPGISPDTMSGEPPSSPDIGDRPHRTSTTTSPDTVTGQELQVEPPVEPQGRARVAEPLLVVVDDPDAGAPSFEAFWHLWPQRNGRKLGKGQARQKWQALGRPERLAAMTGAANYADASSRRLAGAMDAFRWLEKRLWPEWQQPIPSDVASRSDRPPPSRQHVMVDRTATGRWTPGQ